MNIILSKFLHFLFCGFYCLTVLFVGKMQLARHMSQCMGITQVTWNADSQLSLKSLCRDQSVYQRFDNAKLNSLDFVTNRLFTKLFTTTDIRIISLCQELFNFELPSVQLELRCKKSRE